MGDEKGGDPYDKGGDKPVDEKDGGKPAEDKGGGEKK
jgi:hypothetical protein